MTLFIKAKQNTLQYTSLVFVLIAITGLLAYRGAAAVHSMYRQILPDVSVLRDRYPVAVRKEGPHIIFKFQKARPSHWLSLNEIPKQAVAAILLSEDAGFFQHHGYEPEAIRAAIEHNGLPGVKVKRGGSTITQQVVKNLFLSPEKTITRKVRELLLAVEFERKYPKRKILETYLNIAEWGPGTYGIEDASRRYFGKSAATLTPRDAAVLAFMLPNPLKYQNSVKGGELTAFAHKRVDEILERLWKTGHISDKEYTTAEVGDELPSSL